MNHNRESYKCPVCNNVFYTNNRGLMKSHSNNDGEQCAGSLKGSEELYKLREMIGVHLPRWLKEISQIKNVIFFRLVQEIRYGYECDIHYDEYAFFGSYEDLKNKLHMLRGVSEPFTHLSVGEYHNNLFYYVRSMYTSSPYYDNSVFAPRDEGIDIMITDNFGGDLRFAMFVNAKIVSLA